jgi:hypothetical protein
MDVPGEMCQVDSSFYAMVLLVVDALPVCAHAVTSELCHALPCENTIIIGQTSETSRLRPNIRLSHRRQFTHGHLYKTSFISPPIPSTIHISSSFLHPLPFSSVFAMLRAAVIALALAATGLSHAIDKRAPAALYTRCTRVRWSSPSANFLLIFVHSQTPLPSLSTTVLTFMEVRPTLDPA